MVSLARYLSKSAILRLLARAAAAAPSNQTIVGRDSGSCCYTYIVGIIICRHQLHRIRGTLEDPL